MTNHTETLLQTIAVGDREWQSFAAGLPKAFLAADAPLPKRLVDATVELLRGERRELVKYLDAPPPSGAQKLGIIPTVLTFGALLFLLRTHITFERSESGEISFRVEHPGMGDELVVKIVDALKEWVEKVKLK